ncbi:hypothetical protein D3C80_2200350 [compost metagenome]
MAFLEFRPSGLFYEERDSSLPSFHGVQMGRNSLQTPANFIVDWLLSLGMFFELCQRWEQGIRS